MDTLFIAESTAVPLTSTRVILYIQRLTIELYCSVESIAFAILEPCPICWFGINFYVALTVKTSMQGSPSLYGVCGRDGLQYSR